MSYYDNFRDRVLTVVITLTIAILMGGILFGAVLLWAYLLTL